MRDRLRHIVCLARLVRLDGLRRHALLGLVLVALLGEFGGALFFDFIPRDIGRASLDYIMGVSWLTGLVFLLFHAVQVMAWDEERRVIHTLLARPISRADYVLGVFWGLAQLLFLLNCILGGLGWGVLQLIQHLTHSTYFPYFSSWFFLLNWVAVFVLQLSLLAVIMLFSGLVRGGFTVLLMTICYYFTCNGLPVVRDALSLNVLEQGSGSFLYQGLTLLFPDYSRLDFKELAINGDALVMPLQIVSNFSLLLLFIGMVLWLACGVYQRRDLK